MGSSVCLIENRSTLGGVCVNVGCIPSKTLLHGAAVLEKAREVADMGIRFAKPDVDLDKLREYKDNTIGNLTGGLDSQCKARKITRVNGRGLFHLRTRMWFSRGENKRKTGP